MNKKIQLYLCLRNNKQNRPNVKISRETSNATTLCHSMMMMLIGAIQPSAQKYNSNIMDCAHYKIL